MAYLVKYFKEFSNINEIVLECEKDINLGYKIEVISDLKNKCDITHDNIKFIFCENPMEQAVLTARSLFAEKCQFYFEKGGIYSADLSLYDNPEKIGELDYDEAIELAVSGYDDIEVSTLYLAKRNSVRLEILSLNDKNPTIIKEVAGTSIKPFKCITKDTDIVIITLTEIPDKKGATYNIFKTLSDKNVYVDSIMLPAANHNQQDISFCVKSNDKQVVVNLLKDKKNCLEFKDLIVNESVAKISVTGDSLCMQPGIATKVLEVLYECDISVMMIVTTEVRFSVVLEKKYADLAVRAIHKNLI